MGEELAIQIVAYSRYSSEVAEISQGKLPSR
jgi:hypothetical protein